MADRHLDLKIVDGYQYAECDICSGHFRGIDLRKTWDNFMVCQYDWYPEPSFVRQPKVSPNEGGNTLKDPRPSKPIQYQTVGGPDPILPPYLQDQF